MNTAKLRLLTLLGALLSTAAPAAEKPASADDRVIRTTSGFVRERAPDTLRNPLILTETRTAAKRVTVKPKAQGPSAAFSTTPGIAWIFDASAEVFYDLDGDGYYHYLRVQFDADTLYEHLPVYAQLFLSADGDAWEHVYTTDDFRIWGSDPHDDYEVEIELVSGYSTGLYDVLIELYDADYGDLLDEFGPLESAALSLLPLEDAERDGVRPPPLPPPSGGGGAVSWPMLAALLAAAALRRRTSSRRSCAAARAI